MTIARPGLTAALLVLLCTVSSASRATTLSGHVTDAGTGNGVAGASVSGVILFSPTSFLTTTDAGGYYQVNIAAGTYAATASADGYLQANASLNVSADPVVADFVLTRPASVSGTVRVQSSGVGLADETVILTPIDDGTLGGQSVSTDDGSYSITDIQPGHYYACVANPNDGYLDQCFNGMNIPASGISAYTTITLASGDHLTGIDFSLMSGSTITGTLHDSYFQTPIANAPVAFKLISSAQQIVNAIDSTTDANGQFTLQGIAAGDYYLSAGARFVYWHPNTYYFPALHGGGDCIPSCTPGPSNLFTVPAGGVASAIDFSLRPGHIVTGKVTDSQSGLGIGGVTVQTCELPGPLFNITATAKTASDGSYTLSHVLGNGVTHAYTANSLGYVDIAWPNTPIYISTFCDTIDGTSLAFGNPQEQLSDIDFALTTGAAITGQVTATEFPGVGVPAQVEVWKDEGGSLSLAWSGLTDMNGNYESNGLQTGTYYVLAYYGLYEECQVYSGQSCANDGGPPSVDPVSASPLTFDSISTQSGVNLQLAVDIFRNTFE